MGKIKVIKLDDQEKAELETGYHNGDKHGFRKRCHMILLKSKGHTASEIALIMGTCEMSVTKWVNRYLVEGIDGLKTRSGQGRQAILKVETDLEQVRQAVARNRQRVSQVRAELEENLGKQFSAKTLIRFIKKTVAATNELGDWENESRWRKFTG